MPLMDMKKKLSLVSLIPPKKYKLSAIKNIQSSQAQPRKWTQACALLPVYLLNICYGMNSGFPAILTPQLREDCSEFSISEDQESWIVSLDNLFTPLICILSGPVQQKWGSRTMLILCCIPYFVSWFLTAMANSYYVLYLARIFVGFSHALLSTTVYTIEISSNEMRGTNSLLESVLRCCGCVIVYALGLFYRWKSIASVSTVVPVFALVAFYLSPESPCYLVSTNKYKKAERSLKYLYGPDFNTRQEVRRLSESLNLVQKKRARKLEYIHTIRKHPEIYKPFLIVSMLSIVQQFSGVTVLRAYVVKIFDQVFSDTAVVVSNLTISSDASSLADHVFLGDPVCQGNIHRTSQMAYMSAITIGLFRFVASLALARLLLHFRRRIMYLTSLMLSIICLSTFSVFSYLGQTSDSPVYRWGSLVAVCLLVFSVQLGVQTLPFLLSGELFPTDVRATCKGLTRSWTCILLVISLKLFPLIETSLTLHGTFAAFALVLLIFFPIMFFILPETKDLSLDQIQQYFRSNTIIEEDPEMNNRI